MNSPYKWTKKKPTEPGWYWYRDNLTDEDEMVLVTRDKGSLWVEGREVGFKVSDGTGDEWYAGPIHKPEES